MATSREAMRRTVSEFMTRRPYTVSRRDTTRRALELMRRNKIRHLPVVEFDEVVGLISEADLRNASAENLRVQDFMQFQPLQVSMHRGVSELAREMAEQKRDCAIILDDTQSMIGIFTLSDALSLLAEVMRAESTDEDPDLDPDDYYW